MVTTSAIAFAFRWPCANRATCCFDTLPGRSGAAEFSAPPCSFDGKQAQTDMVKRLPATANRGHLIRSWAAPCSHKDPDWSNQDPKRIAHYMELSNGSHCQQTKSSTFKRLSAYKSAFGRVIRLAVAKSRLHSSTGGFECNGLWLLKNPLF